MIFFLLMLLTISAKSTDAACTWPADFVDSTWIDSLKGDMEFSSSTMSGWSFDVNIQAQATTQTLDSWECVAYVESGPYLIMKTSDSFTQFVTEQYTAYRCIIPEKITDYSYRYYQTEPIQSSLGYERVFINPNAQLTDPSVLCQFPSTGAEFQVMVKKGYETSAKVTCPYNLLADYTFTYAESDGTVTCDTVNDEGSVNMCTNITDISINAPSCSPYPLYTSGNTSWCMDVVTVESDTFVSLYSGPQDSGSSNTYQFACVGINSDGSAMSVTPQHCKASQSPTEIPVDNSGNDAGAVWSLSITGDPCPPCPTLSDPFRGSVTKTTNGAATTAFYSCDGNYTLSGNDTRICQTSGEWSGSAPSCTCPLPGSISNGNIEISEDGLTATFTCEAGYVLIGSSALNCDIVTNEWSDTYPTCDECETLPAPVDGSVTLASTGLTSVATYACDTGTTMNGDPSRTCNTDTSWTNSAPTCTSCPTLSNITSGNVTFNTDDIVTTATYYCAMGYTLNGDETSTCTVSGSWDSTPPVCECDDPVSPGNGTVTVSDDKTQASYTCLIGFTLHGASTRNCQDDGTGWSSNGPVCVGCQTLSGPGNGSVELSTNGTLTLATFKCEVGFTLKGEVTSQCQIDGTWSTITPTCSQCEVLPTVSSGSYTLITDGSTTSAQYSCSVGTTISGEVTVACDVNGVWSISSENTSCVECPALAATGGNYEISSDGTTSTAELVCESGYMLENGGTIECQSNGSWSSSSSESQCVSTAQTPESSNNSLLPAVIVLAILAGILGIISLLFLYLWKKKEIPKESGETKTSSENDYPSRFFPAAKPPDSFMQHVLDYRNTSSAMSAPIGHHPSPRMDSITPRSMRSTPSTSSLHLSHLNLIREDTTSTVILDGNNPAPWIQRPKHDNGMSLSKGIFPPLNESKTSFVSPRSGSIEKNHPRKKKRSFSKKMQRQNSINTGDEEDVSDDDKRKSTTVKTKSESVKQTARPKVAISRNSSAPKHVGTTSNGGLKVPKLILSSQTERASTPVNHQIEVNDPDKCKTPRSNTFTTVQ